MSAIKITNPLNEPDWDQWVATHPGATPFHTSAWLRVLADTYGYEPLAWVNPSGTNPSLLVVMDVSTRFSTPRGVGLPFSDDGQPLLNTPQEWPLFFDALQQEAQERKWKTIELRGGLEDQPGVEASSTFYRHTLALSPDIESLFSRLHNSTRRNIQKAEKAGLVTRMEKGPDALEAFCHLNDRTRRRHGLPPQPRKFFYALQEHMIEKELAEVVLMQNDSKVIAGAVYLRHGDTFYYKYGASDERVLSLRGNDLVMWNAIRHYAGQGAKSLCLGRTDLGHEGLRRYKKGWGSEESTLSYTQYHVDTQRYGQANLAVDGIHNHVFRHLPLPLLRTVGSLLYKHMA